MAATKGMPWQWHQDRGEVLAVSSRLKRSKLLSSLRSWVQLRSRSTILLEWPGGVVREVSEPEGGFSQGLEPPIDRYLGPLQAPAGRSVAGRLRRVVRGDHALVDTPGCFHLNVRLRLEQRGHPDLFLLGEEPEAGLHGVPGPVERVFFAAPMPVKLVLNPAPGRVRRVAR